MPDPKEPASPATEAELADAIKKAQETEAKPNAPIEMQLATGEVVKAKDQAELIEKLKGMKENTTLHAKKVEEENAALRGRVAELEASKKPVQTDSAGFDNKRYWDLMGQDPLAAQNYLDAFRFGIENPEDVPKAFQTMYTRSEMFQDNVEMSKFYRLCPEFPGGDQAAEILLKEYSEMFGDNIKAENLATAFYQSVSKGSIKPISGGEQRGGERRPMPTLGGTSPAAPDRDVMSDFAALDADQMEAVINRIARQNK